MASRGQVEALRAQVEARGLPLLLLPAYQGGVWHHLLLQLVCWCSSLPVPLVALHPSLPGLPGLPWLLRRLGVRALGLEEELGRGRSVQAWVGSRGVRGEVGLPRDLLLALGREGDVLVVPCSVTTDLPAGTCWWAGRGARAVVGIDQAFSLREMVGWRGGAGMERVVAHVEQGRRALARVTGSQVLAFLRSSSYCSALGVGEEQGWGEVLEVLRSRGVRGVWRGEPCLATARRRVEGMAEEEVWREARQVARHWVPEAAVAVAALSLAREGLGGSRATSAEGAATVSQEQVVARATQLVRMVGEGGWGGPCKEAGGVVTEGVARAEHQEGLGREQGRRESQHQEGRWVRRVRRQMEREEGEEATFRDTPLCLGTSARGRRWLVWAAALLRRRLAVLALVAGQLPWVAREQVVEVRRLAAEVVEQVGDKELVLEAVEVLQEGGVVEVAREAGEVWVGVATGWVEEDLQGRLVGGILSCCL